MTNRNLLIYHPKMSGFELERSVYGRKKVVIER